MKQKIEKKTVARASLEARTFRSGETQNNTAAITVNNSWLEINGIATAYVQIPKDHLKHQIEVHKLK